MGFTYNVIIFTKYANVYMLHGTKINENLDCRYYATYTHKNFNGILHACKNGRVVHYFEYADLKDLTVWKITY